MEMCDHRQNITMCPLCDKACSYWQMSSACATARASHLFDNPATVFFSVFMALWGKQSLAACGLQGRGDFALVPPWPSFRLEILRRLCWPGMSMGGGLGGDGAPLCLRMGRVWAASRIPTGSSDSRLTEGGEGVCS